MEKNMQIDVTLITIYHYKKLDCNMCLYTRALNNGDKN